MPEKSSEVILIMVAAVFIIVILVVLIVFSLFVTQKRKFSHIRQIQDLKARFDKEILKAQIEIQTSTFETVSRELHDNVSNTIALAVLRLNLISAKSDATFVKEVDEACDLLLEAKKAVRDFSWTINPANMEESGLANSLRELAGKLTDMRLLNVGFAVSGVEFSVNAGTNIILYRIVQEALSNIIKHAGTATAKIELLFDYPLIKLAVKDEGKGFDAALVKLNAFSGHASGLRNLEARAKMMGATLAIESEPGKGTAICVNYKATEMLPENPWP